MSYVVHTGNRAYVTSPPRIPAPVMHDDSLEENEWALYEDDEPITRPRQITEETPGEIRAKLHELDPGRFPLKVTFKPAPEPTPAARPSPLAKERRPMSTNPAPQLPSTELSPAIMIADPDTGEIVTVDSDMHMEAMRAQDEVQHHWESGWRHLVSFGLAVKHVVERRLYLALGFTSLEAYAQDKFGYGRKWVYERIAVASKLQEAGVDPMSVRSGGHFPKISQLRKALALPIDQFAAFVGGELSGKTEDTKAIADVHVVTAEVKADKPIQSDPDVERAKREAVSALKRAEEAEQRKTELEAERDATKRDAIEAKKMANRLVARVEELENRTAPEPEKVTVDNPELLARITALEQANAAKATELEQTRTQLAELSARMGPDLSAATEAQREELAHLEARRAKLQPDVDREAALQGRAFKVNRAIAEIEDVVTRNRGIIQTAKGREYGKYIDLEKLYPASDLLLEIVADLKQIAADCGP